MCGIAGFVGFHGLNDKQSSSVAEKMAEAITHRGPDHAGMWQDEAAQVALIHRRLSIIDLSPAGHQPMESASGRYQIIFNGEIYNHEAIRTELEERVGSVWKGRSDTETLLASIEEWGLDTTLQKAIGMFAIALWDRQKKTLSLARDRAGEKPLYYGWQQGVFLFASELKALKCHPAFEGKIDRNSMALQLRYNYIPAPYSIYKDIRKLSPGCVLRMQKTATRWKEDLKPYWSFADQVVQRQNNPFEANEGEAVKTLDELLHSAIGQQMEADVPLGAFLSGGVDSSIVVAIMQAQQSRAVKTFTIGFDEPGYNEAEHAKAVARYLGTEHTELYVSAQQAIDVIPRLPSLYDEPFSDSSQIPTFIVSEMTRKNVTVSLSGDAGDELFGGYNRYFGTQKWWNKIEILPYWMRLVLSKGLMFFGAASWDLAGQVLGSVIGKKERFVNLGNKMTKFAGVIGAENNIALYQHFVSHWRNPEAIIVDSREPDTHITNPPVKLDNMVEQMMGLDFLTYMTDDILVKVDRAAMGVSLETRCPFLDHRVIEFAWTLPLSMKVRNGQGKWILRQVLDQYVPRSLIDRPKMGFAVPIDSWLRGPLRDWAESLLDETRLEQEGYYNPLPIRQKWAEHLSGRRNWQHYLWDVLMFQAWLEKERKY